MAEVIEVLHAVRNAALFASFLLYIALLALSNT